jgi:hypothetical protein
MREYCQNEGPGFGRLSRDDRFIQVKKPGIRLMTEVSYVVPVLAVALSMLLGRGFIEK